jgi:hypothetical protein
MAGKVNEAIIYLYIMQKYKNSLGIIMDSDL